MGQGLTNRFKNYNTDEVFDDFNTFVTGGLWSTVTINSSTTAADDVQTTGKVSSVKYTTGTTANNAAGLTSTKQNFLLGDVCYAGQRFLYTSHGSNDAGLVFGFSTVATALGLTTLVAPTTSYYGAVIYKIPDGTLGANYGVQSSNGATKTSTATNMPATDSVAHLYEVCLNYYDGSNAMVTYLVDGIQLADANNIPIQHKVATSGATKMYVVSFVVTPDTNAISGWADFISTEQRRI